MFLDIAFGLFAGSLIEHPYLGVLFALLPDIDFFLAKIIKQKLFQHRGVTHAPIIYLGIGSLLFFIDLEIGMLFIMCTIFHLIHDLMVIGKGVMVCWPFSNNRLKIFPDNGGRGYLETKLLWWNESNTPLYTFNKIHNGNWVRDWYFRPNLFVFIETVLGLMFLYLYFTFNIF